MHAWFRRVVTALTEALVPAVARPVSSTRVGQVVDFICRQQRRMPDYLRFPFLLISLAFDLWPFLGGRARPFHRLSLTDRRQQIHIWQSSRWGFRRDLVRFYQVLAVFGVVSFFEDEPPGEHGHDSF